MDGAPRYGGCGERGRQRGWEKLKVKNDKNRAFENGEGMKSWREHRARKGRE